MEQKIIKVYYDENGIPYQDLALTKPYSIIGSDFTGANNATEVRFYVANIDDTYTWVANIKLQDGTMTYRLLTSATDEESEPYKLLVLDNGITSKKGFIYVGLNGYGGETLIEEVEGELVINGSPTIVATGTISIALNYTPIVIPLGTSIEPTEMQQILGALSSKQDSFELHNVRGYNTFELAEADELDEGQIVIVRGNPTKIYQKQSGELNHLDSVGDYLPLSGGTMSGAISQPVAPLADNDLANKKYVDDEVAPVAEDIADILDGDLTVHTAYHAEMDVYGRNLVDLAKTSDLTNGTITVKKAETAQKDFSGNVITSTYATKTENALKADKTTTILDIPLDNNILLGEFKTALGEATQSLSGLMSATDKSRLDALHDLLEEGSANDVVDSINEILAIFNNYPEGADFVTALAGKVDKVEGMQLTHNDYSDIEKDKVAQAYAHKSLTNNPHATTFAQLGSKPTTLSGFGITDAYTKAYIDSLKDLNGWESELITSTPLTNSDTIALSVLQGFDCIKLFARNTSTGEIDTDSFDTSLGLVSGYVYKLFDNDDITFTIGSPNCTFLTSAGYELSIIGQKYTPLTADKVAYGETSNVEAELDKINIPNYEEVTHTALQSEITATNDIEIKDDSGELVKITGNAPTNLIRNSDLLIDSNSDNVPDGFEYGTNTTDISLTNGIAKFTVTAQYSYFGKTSLGTIGLKYYQFCKFKSDSNSVGMGGMIKRVNHSGSGNFEYLSVVGDATGVVSVISDYRTSGFTPIEVDYMGAYNVSDMIRQGVKNDSGVLFSALTNEEIKEQLDIWHEVGYPTHINKLISKSDNLFNGKFKTISSLDSENLISNSDLLIDSNSDNVPDGFEYGTNTTDISLTNGIAKFTVTAQYSYFGKTSLGTIGLKYYQFCKFKSDSNSVGMGGMIKRVNHSGSGNFEYLSVVGDATGVVSVISDYRTSGFTPIEVDYMGAINITDLVSRGILPSGLTNAQYKEMLDNAMYNNVPLRESDFISVEPSVAYRLIKASENSAIHKVIEYTADNQVVKVNSVDYSGNPKISPPITMNALTRKVKLISDLMDRVPNLVSNSDLLIDSNSDGVPDGFYFSSNATDRSLTNGIVKFIATSQDAHLHTVFNLTIGIKYYVFGNIKSSVPNVVGLNIPTPSRHSGSGNFELVSNVFTSTDNRVIRVIDYRTSDFTPIEVDYMGAYNITDFKDKGVADDNGTLFSRLTNGEIKAQMDLWVQNGFPDHVINALYPSGADTAISLKYNDGDAIYYPQVIDELPLDITLRSGEYWQDGYIVKANGNAEASPLGKVFSAWNYGQIEAIYDSGVPADFKVKYAQNTSAQVSTHSEYLKEARERIDTLRTNQEQLIEKLGIDVDNDVYDSFVGITSDTFEYYALEGIKSGNILKVEGRGQSVANLLVNTIASSITGLGLTITYDNTTGMFTVNGTTTGAGNIILKTGMNFGLPVGTTCQLMRYYDSGTINLNGSYCGYVISGTSVSNRINENSESLYDPYINGVGELKTSGANPNVAGTSGQSLLFQVYKAGMVFTDFKFKVALYEGTKLLPFAMPETTNNTDVDVYNRTANLLDMGTSDIAYTTVSGITIGYNALAQEFVISGTATANNTITLKASVLDVISGDRVSIKRLFQSGDITAVSTLPTIELFDGTSVVLANSIYKMTAPDGQTPTPDVSFNTGTISADGTLTLRLQFKDDDVFDNYRFRLMIHDKSTDIGYVAYNRTLVGSLTANANEADSFEFSAIDFGVLEFIPKHDKLNIVYGDTIADTDNSVLEYNAGIQSANRKLSVLESRITALDNPFRDKVIAIWGDSRESNNPTSDPQGIGDQKDTSYPALLAKKLGATVLNYGLSGGAWAENTVQQDAGSAIVNRVLTEDTSASADVIIISSMNDFKLATPLGSSATSNKDATTFYGAMRLTYDRLATKYPSKKIWLVLPQKRFDESTNYGGGDYLSYRKAQIDVAKEYGIPTIDLYNNFPNTKPTFYATNMLNDTHFSAVGNDLVAEIIMRSLLGNGNSGVVETLPALPTTDGTYTLKLTVLNGVNTFSWILDS